LVGIYCAMRPRRKKMVGSGYGVRMDMQRRGGLVSTLLSDCDGPPCGFASLCSQGENSLCCAGQDILTVLVASISDSEGSYELKGRSRMGSPAWHYLHQDEACDADPLKFRLASTNHR
jgi:hypothetical protein